MSHLTLTLKSENPDSPFLHKDSSIEPIVGEILKDERYPSLQEMHFIKSLEKERKQTLLALCRDAVSPNLFFAGFLSSGSFSELQQNHFRELIPVLLFANLDTIGPISVKEKEAIEELIRAFIGRTDYTSIDSVDKVLERWKSFKKYGFDLGLSR